MYKNMPRYEQPALPRISYTGFGGYCSAEQGFVRPERFGDVKAALQADTPSIALRGLGRSYGDAALNESGALLLMERLDRCLAFDREARVLKVEAGVRVLDIMRIVVPMGLTLAVVPGFGDITVGGCAAFDIHSKNHWRSGGFGDWVISLRMMLANGEVVDCTRTSNAELFYATVGGLGLTGVILEVEIQLDVLPGTLVQNKSQPFEGLEELFARFQESIAAASYSVAWIDMLNGKKPTGIVIASSFSGNAGIDNETLWRQKPKKPLGLMAPFFNTMSNRAFNLMFAAKHRMQSKVNIDLRAFLFPWDALANWNRLYGKPGFVEYQCCIPLAQAEDGLKEIISAVSARKPDFPVFFAAVKRMRTGIGMLSFPVEGYSLLLDFPVREGIFKFLDEIDAIVAEHGGRVYLAKDGRLSAAAFARMYPRREDWLKIREAVDPGQRFSSNMGRRLNLGCR